MFMALETLDKGQDESNEEEAKVDLEGGLTSGLAEIQRLEKKNKKEMMLTKCRRKG